MKLIIALSVLTIGTACTTSEEYKWADPMKKHCAEFAQATEDYDKGGPEIQWDLTPEGKCRLHPVQP